MSQSITNMQQVWMSNTNTYNAIAMSVSTLGYGANGNSSLLLLNVDGNNKFKIDGSGRVSMFSQPAFSAIGNGTQSWSGATTQTKVDFSTGTQYVNSNKSSGWSQANSRFTAPIAGTYEFSISFALYSDAPVTGPAGLLYKNGSSVGELCIGYFSTTYCQATGSIIIDLVAGDYIEFYISNYNGTTFTVDRSRCRFHGKLLG